MTRLETLKQRWIPTTETSVFELDGIRFNDVIKSKSGIHEDINRYWRVLDIYTNSVGKTRIWTELCQDTETMNGFSSIKREFTLREIEFAI